MSGSAKCFFEFGGDGAQGNLIASVRHVAESYSEFSNNPDATELPSYTSIDLNFNMVFIEGWSLGLFVKNLNDDRVVTNIDPERSLPDQFSIARPRTYGLSPQKHFF